MCGGTCQGHNGDDGHCCRPSGGGVRGFIQPWLLLMLLQRPGYGYELMERLAENEETPEADPGMLYRTLRNLEGDGLVRSMWDTTGTGPARRLYEVTPEGREYLHAWAVNIRQTRAQLDRFLAEYKDYFTDTER
ncbi:MAG: PadR family transcriptional regulator [Anaerolineae bacterium]|jgi:PadR family transcriptional regulator PadR